MPANIDPVYSRIGAVANSTIATPTAAFPTLFGATANTTLDLSSTTGSQIIFTADTTNGSFLRSIIIKQGGPSATISTAAVARFFWNNGGTVGSAGNQFLWKEFTLPAVTPSTTVTSPDYEIPCNVILPPGHRIYGVISVVQTTTGYFFIGVGGHL